MRKTLAEEFCAPTQIPDKFTVTTGCLTPENGLPAVSRAFHLAVLLKTPGGSFAQYAKSRQIHTVTTRRIPISLWLWTLDTQPSTLHPPSSFVIPPSPLPLPPCAGLLTPNLIPCWVPHRPNFAGHVVLQAVGAGPFTWPRVRTVRPRAPQQFPLPPLWLIAT
jgi:hypothetical protein